jgi:predicted small secreted protein
MIAEERAGLTIHLRSVNKYQLPLQGLMVDLFAMKLCVLIAIPVLALTSCNTMIGVGRDFRQLGSGMENVAHGREFGDSGTNEAVPTY